MSKKDFELIAETLDKLRESLSKEDHETVCRQFADRLLDTNSRFNRERFLKACGCS